MSTNKVCGGGKQLYLVWMQVAFVPNTHYAFTVGKDGSVKYWDADRWELLLTLEGHKAEVSHALLPPGHMSSAISQVMPKAGVCPIKTYWYPWAYGIYSLTC